MKMNLANAFAFVGVGLVMEALRFLSFLNYVRELWLLVMGGVLLAIGGAVLAHAGWWRIVVPSLRVWVGALLPERISVDPGMPEPEVRGVGV